MQRKILLTENQKRPTTPIASKTTADSVQSSRRASRPLTANQITDHITSGNPFNSSSGNFRRNTTRSYSFRSRPISAGHRGKFILKNKRKIFIKIQNFIFL